MSLPWRKPRKKRPLVKVWTPPAPVAKKAPAKKAAAKKAPVKKAAAKKAPAKKAAAKKAAVKKAPAKKIDLWKPDVPEHPLFVPLTALPEWAHTLMGSGTEIIEFPEVVRDSMVVQITHDGPHRFNFQFRDQAGGDEVFAISGTGSFHGRYALNFLDRSGFKYLVVEATSAWILHFEPVSAMRVLAAQAGARLEGEGSDVIRFHAEQPMRLDFSAPHTTSGSMIVGNSTQYRRRLLWVSRGGDSTILTEVRTMVLEIQMNTPWSNDTRWALTVGEIPHPQA
jgi:hypothetical protein